MNELDKITARFGSAYDKNKRAKTWLEKQQARLFKAFDQEIAKQTRGQRSDRIPQGVDINTYVKTHHPGWHVISRMPLPHGHQGTNVILEEDAAQISYTHVNHDTGMVYGRDRVEGSPYLDDEALKLKHPDLYDRITTWPEPWYSLVKDIVLRFTSLPWSPDALDGTIGTILASHGVLPVIRDLNTLNNKDLAIVELYINPGPVSVRLRPPRKAKPEELEDGNH